MYPIVVGEEEYVYVCVEFKCGMERDGSHGLAAITIGTGIRRRYVAYHCIGYSSDESSRHDCTYCTVFSAVGCVPPPEHQIQLIRFRPQRA